MPDEKDDKPTSLDRVRGDRGLARPSGFIARRSREVAQQVRELSVSDNIEVVFADKNLEAAVRKALEEYVRSVRLQDAPRSSRQTGS